MAKPKAQTLVQKLGFMDDDLKSSEHDNILIWVNENILKIVNSIFTTEFKPQILDLQWEHAIISGKFTVGFIDICVRLENDFKIYFEAKTKIPSAGELIRQINFYKNNGASDFRDGNVSAWHIVVSPDTKYRDLLVSQNIGFLEYSKDKNIEVFLSARQREAIPRIERYIKTSQEEKERNSGKIENACGIEILSQWNTILEKIFNTKKSTWVLLKEGKLIGFDGKEFVIEFPRNCSFHKEKLNQAEELKLIESCASEIMQSGIKVAFISGD